MYVEYCCFLLDSSYPAPSVPTRPVIVVWAEKSSDDVADRVIMAEFADEVAFCAAAPMAKMTVSVSVAANMIAEELL